MEFPRFVYRAPGPCRYSGGARYGFVVVESIVEYDEHLSRDYHATPLEAITAAGESAFTAHLNKAQRKRVMKLKPWERLEPVQKPLQAPIEPESIPEVPDDSSPPTRAEMQAKAMQLGVKFDGRTTDAALMRRIEAALQGPL